MGEIWTIFLNNKLKVFKLYDFLIKTDMFFFIYKVNMLAIKHQYYLISHFKRKLILNTFLFFSICCCFFLSLDFLLLQFNLEWLAPMVETLIQISAHFEFFLHITTFFFQWYLLINPMTYLNPISLSFS